MVQPKKVSSLRQTLPRLLSHSQGGCCLPSIDGGTHFFAAKAAAQKSGGEANAKTHSVLVFMTFFDMFFITFGI